MLYLYIIDKIYINSIDEENVTNQTCTATDYRPSYHGNRKRDTSLRMIDFARTVQNFGSSCVWKSSSAMDPFLPTPRFKSLTILMDDLIN